MLILSRSKGEKVMIAEDIEVVVLEIRKDKVRLGFIAPGDVPIDREEVRELKERVPQYAEA